MPSASGRAVVDGDEGRALDGNGVAAGLYDVFEQDVTTAVRTCQGCGEATMLGAHRAYRSAGVVLRCPSCGEVALTIVTAGARRHVRIAGELILDLPGDPLA
jgi:ribosomal protein S27AE